MSPVTHIRLINEIADFPGWRTDFFTFDDPFGMAQRMADDFVKTRDIRRSRIAQQLVDREDPQQRAQRAAALFTWADKDGDGRLSLDEFRQALPAPE